MTLTKSIHKVSVLSILMTSSVISTNASMACPDHDEKQEVTANKQRRSPEGHWMRPGHQHKNTAAYVCACKLGLEDGADKLLSAACDVAHTVELHDHINENGIMKMRPVSFIEIGKGLPATQPGGKHIMLMGLKRNLQKGEKIVMKLTFKKAGIKDVEFTVDQL